MKYNYQGHSALLIEFNNGERAIIDPFIQDNPQASLSVDEIQVDYVILTHGHDDHIGDTVELCKANDALLIAPVELAQYLETKGCRIHDMNIGGKHSFDFGVIQYVQALHSAAIFRDDINLYLGPSCGVVITADNECMYHLGDTGLFSDLQLIGQLNEVDTAFIPIGSNYTMDPSEAALAAKYIQPKQAVPIHYNTFEVIQQDPNEFIEKLDDITGVVPTIGNWYPVKLGL